MKIVYIIICLFVTLSSPAQISKVEIAATGLTCSMCSNAIYKQLKTIRGIDTVMTDLNKNLFIVHIKPNMPLTPQIFREKVEAAGFFIGSMELLMSLPVTEISDNLKVGQYTFIDSKAKTETGEIRVRVLNKGYVTTKEYNKLLRQYNKYPSFLNNSEDIFHIKTL